MRGARADTSVQLADRAFLLPFVPGRLLVAQMLEPRYRLSCELCVEDVLSVSFWLDVAIRGALVHGLRHIARRRVMGFPRPPQRD